MRLTLQGTLSYTRLQLCAGGPEKGAGVKLDVYFAFETLKKGKDWRKRGRYGGRKRGGWGGSCCCGMT